jgi:hypothetical protein
MKSVVGAAKKIVPEVAVVFADVTSAEPSILIDPVDAL